MTTGNAGIRLVSTAPCSWLNERVDVCSYKVCSSGQCRRNDGVHCSFNPFEGQGGLYVLTMTMTTGNAGIRLVPAAACSWLKDRVVWMF